MFLPISFAIQSIIPPARPSTTDHVLIPNKSGTTIILHTATPPPSTGTVSYSGCNVCVSWGAFVFFPRQSNSVYSLRHRTVAVYCRDARFKAHQGHGCVSLASVVCCHRRGLCDGLITHPEDYYRTRCVLSVIMKPQQ